jgi:hypothetical protein
MLGRRKFLSLFGLAALSTLAACGDHEAERAQAFAKFLQDRILDRPGVHIPILSAEERDAIGHFEADFAILKGFNDDLSASVRSFADALHPAPINVQPLDLPKYRPDLVKAREFFPAAAAGVDSALAKAQSARAALKQPDAVKAKYDAAFEQIVMRPANALRDLIPLAIPAMDAEIAIADFMEAHKADFKAVGGQLQTSKPNLRKQLETLASDYAAKFAKMQTARDKLEATVQGR